VSSAKPTASVVASGIIAIIGSCLAILGCLLGILGLSLISSTSPAASLPASVKGLSLAGMCVLLGIAIFGIFAGAGILRLKNWARVSVLIWAAITVLISSVALLFTLVLPLPETPGAPAGFATGAKAFVAFFYTIPLVIGIWWLILFNRRAIRAQFTGAGMLAEQAASPAKPRCPLPVAVVAGFFLFSFVCCFAFALFGLPLPVVLFGRLLHGSLGSGIFSLTAVLILASAIGLLKLKRWSYPLLMALQLFWLISGTVTFLSPGYARTMQEVLGEMHLPQQESVSQMYMQSRSLAFFGLLPSLVVLAILFYYRNDFRKAAEAREKTGA